MPDVPTSFNRVPWTVVWGGIVVVAAVFLLTTIKPGQPWDGDAELYIIDALSILHGDPYGAGGYVFNPDNPINPVSYPPGLPLMMVPILAVAGVNYVAIKVMLVSCLIGFLVLLTRIARDRLDPAGVAVLVAAVGFNPFIWHFKDIVFSEFPFILLAYAALFCVDRIDHAVETGVPAGRWIILAGLTLAGACLVRTAGIAVVAAVAGLAVLRFRRLWRPGLAALAVAGAAFVLLNHLFPADVGSYADTFDDWDLGDLWDNFTDSGIAYLHGFAGVLGGSGGGATGVLRPLAAAAGLGLAAFGSVRQACRRLSVFELFLGAYLGLLLIYPMAEEPMRYGLPIFPLLLLYALAGIGGVRLRRGGTMAVPVLLALLLIALYVPQFARPLRGANLSVDQAEARQLYQEIRRWVPPGDLIVTTYPTIIALHTGRRAAIPPEDATVDDFWDFVHDSHARWLIEEQRPLSNSVRDLMPSLRSRLRAVYANRLFVLHRILPKPPSVTTPSPTS